METSTEEQKKVHVLKATAVRQAMVEVLSEQREEILKRAAAKLVAMGVKVEAEDLDAQIS